MKRIITMLLIILIFLLTFSSCETYENITFIERDGERCILYQGNEYYETSIFSATEYYAVANENDLELGYFYSFPFSTRFYSDKSDSPIYIYSIGSKTSFYLIEGYSYLTDTFVIANTSEELIWNDIFISKQSDDYFIPQYTINLYSKQCKRIQTSVEIAFIEDEWYLYLPGSNEIWITTDEFIAILADNGII